MACQHWDRLLCTASNQGPNNLLRMPNRMGYLNNYLPLQGERMDAWVANGDLIEYSPWDLDDFLSTQEYRDAQGAPAILVLGSNASLASSVRAAVGRAPMQTDRHTLHSPARHHSG
jgi:hypothetical protein